MRNLETIRSVVRETLAAEFENVEITEVNVAGDVDSDGEDILRIEIIFRGGPSDLNAGKLSGAVRRLRPKLSDIGEGAFPLLSFVSLSDAERRQGAAA